MRVTRFSSAPVRSLALVHPVEIDLTERGVSEDRRFRLIDDADRLVDRLIVGCLATVKATTDAEATRLRLEFADGSVVDEEVELGAPIVAHVYERNTRSHVVLGPWSSALTRFVGRNVRLVRTDEIGGTRMAHPATMVTAGSLARLAQQLNVPSIDGRRFRMLIELDGQLAHEEDEWIGRAVTIGEAVLGVSGPVPRCAITTQDPDSGVRDLDTLRALVDYRGAANFGVFGEVMRPGRVRVGDELTVSATVPPGAIGSGAGTTLDAEDGRGAQ